MSEVAIFPKTHDRLPEPAQLRIADIQIKDRARCLDDNWVEVLAAMIGETGLINPIRVWKDTDGVIFLVAGHHRMAAHILLERETIAVTWSQADSWEAARLEEVLENLGRNELTALDRAQHLFEMKQVYEALYPDTKAGVAGGKAIKSTTEIISFVGDASEKVGLSERAIQMAVAMWKGLSKDTRATVQGTWLADHQANLMGLSKQSAHMQKKLVAILLDEANEAKSIPDALLLTKRKSLPGHWERKFKGLNQTLSSLPDESLFEVLDGHEARILAWVKSRGLV